MATYTIDEIAITRTASNIDDDDVFELQIKDGGSDDLKSAKITRSELAKALRKSVIHKGFLSQGGTNAPTESVKINELGVTVTFSYVGVGGYMITATGMFNTIPFLNVIVPTAYGHWTHTIQDANTTYLETFDTSGTPSNGILTNTPFELEVFL